MSQRKHITSLPAPGWTCFQFWLEDGVMQHCELPVVGWDVYAYPEDKEGEGQSEYELNVWDEFYVQSVHEVRKEYPSHKIMVFPPDVCWYPNRAEIEEALKNRAAKAKAAEVAK
jgi:hypothetical protein